MHIRNGLMPAQDRYLYNTEMLAKKSMQEIDVSVGVNALIKTEH